MNKTLLAVMVIWLLHSSYAVAQSRMVSGTVISQEDDLPLPGVSVVLKGTTKGTVTGVEGDFSLSVPEEGGTLVFSFIGMLAQEVPISNRAAYDVKMAVDSRQLSEVVVTALGFKVDKDKQGSTASVVEAAALKRGGETGVINGISGRASGVQITKSAGDPGAGSTIQIRGQNTITGSNQPLVIVDGIPISNSTLGSEAAGVTQQSRLNDLNPEDIASMQVLKGASAAALWGSRAANGVIVITTKKGAEGKMSLSFNSTLSFDRPNRLHPLQNIYGQGSNGVYSPTAANSWGDKIAARSGGEDVVDMSGARFEAYNGQTIYPILQKNSTETYQESLEEAVFRTGTYLDNNLSLSGGNDQGNFYLSLGDLRQEGILNGTSDYKRSSVRFNTQRQFNEIVRASVNANYVRSTSNRVQRSNSVNGLYIAMLRTPADFDSRAYIGDYYASPTASAIPNRQRAYRNYLGANPNPIYNSALWAINELTNFSEVDRFIVSSELVISPTNWFDVTARGGVDSYTDQRITDFPMWSASANGLGNFTEEMYKENEMNFDLIGRATKDFGSNITSTLIVGFNVNDRKYYRLGGSMTNYVIADAPLNFVNSTRTNNEPFNNRSNRRMARLYSTVNLGFYNQLYLNVSAAGEAGSTFGSTSRSTFYYPSADVAWQFTELDALSENSFLSFGKLRASYGIVGIQPEPYRNTTTFVDASFSDWSSGLSGAGYGGAFVQSSRQGDPELRPEQKTEWEVGTDLRFLNNKLSLGFTYYQNQIEDLLLDVSTAASTGFTQRYTNAGTMENKGLELDLNYNLVQSESFGWNIFANASRNKNQVTDLAGTDIITLGGFSTTASTVAKVGYSLSSLYGGAYLRNENGSLNLNANGFPQVAPTFEVLGDPNPDWRGGFGTNLTYKKFSLNVLFETSQGGDMYEGTRGVLYNFGRHADVANEVTLTEDLVNYAGNVIPAGSTVRGNIQDFGAGPVLLDQSYYTSIGGGFSTLVEQFVSDASWTRLRELSVGYSLSSAGFREKTKLQSIDFTVTARNPILWTNIQGIDPETNLNGVGNSRGQDYFNSPNTKSLVFSLRFNY
ncbi:SusC/RagA family TonB-linked outer membrane protein [Pontibacter diazotrophicus]|uniref:SusC/RagA family TonB-linked outer membrane protein n=1 Tax=Pontibacter diazotrophicus TaxID=1400979 RepID=A0A3D8L819_9BACT|nr:SusC/RagA family TonB-linked outer membrane protein [Pontibacter diazotrophicus]RDV13473.1 SusC/RagA family TonB-linked outer membrane protein [Pontibacter diazotrophicus]